MVHLCCRLIVVCLPFCYLQSVLAAQWPTYGHDESRSFKPSKELTFPLSLRWEYESKHTPKPAWPLPAIQDYWHNIRDLQPALTFDRAFQPVVANGKLFFGSSADDKLICLDAETGDTVWDFYTEGPIRLAPVISGNRIFFGSDDGCVYCLERDSGRLNWQTRCAPDVYQIPGNERVISLWPVRTSPLVIGDTLFVTAGLFPKQDVFLVAMNIENGSIIWRRKIELTPQGYLLATTDSLIVPGSRTEPRIYNLANGDFKQKIDSPGGDFVSLANGQIITGPGRRTGLLSVYDPTKEKTLATIPGKKVVVDGDRAFVLTTNSVSALRYTKYLELYQQVTILKQQKEKLKKRIEKTRRKALAEKLEQLNGEILAGQKTMQACYTWRKPVGPAHAMFLCSRGLLVGGENRVTVLNPSQGEQIWNIKVDGKVYGMAAVNHRLYVSTDKGILYCFGDKQDATPRYHRHRKTKDDVTALVSQEHTRILDVVNRQVRTKRGYCLILSSGEGHLARDLALRTDYQIIGLEDDPEKVRSSRRMLDKLGLYGRVSIQHHRQKSLPFGSYLFNLILCQGRLLKGQKSEHAISEIARVLRPEGGVAILAADDEDTRQWTSPLDYPECRIAKDPVGLSILTRGKLPGAGEWTQLYADSAHSACSRDRSKGPFTIQWFGRPGPRQMIDRHHRPMSSLYKDGRLFITGNDQVYAVDAYNGSRLWQRTLSQSRRVGAMKNCGHMLLTEEDLWVVTQNTCNSLDVSSGRPRYHLQIDPSKKRDWGYLNISKELIIGSSQKQGASFNQFGFGNDPDKGTNQFEGDYKEIVVSESLFAMSPVTPKTIWSYRNGGIMNNAIAVSGGKVFFAESRNPQVKNDKDGRMRVDHFCQSDLYAVALDSATGKLLWEKALELPYEHIMFLTCARDLILFSGSFNQGKRVYYSMVALDSRSGQAKWESRYVALDIRAHRPQSSGRHPRRTVAASRHRRRYRLSTALCLRSGDRQTEGVYRSARGTRLRRPDGLTTLPLRTR